MRRRPLKWGPVTCFCVHHEPGRPPRLVGAAFASGHSGGRPVFAVILCARGTVAWICPNLGRRASAAGRGAGSSRIPLVPGRWPKFSRRHGMANAFHPGTPCPRSACRAVPFGYASGLLPQPLGPASGPPVGDQPLLRGRMASGCGPRGFHSVRVSVAGHHGPPTGRHPRSPAPCKLLDSSQGSDAGPGLLSHLPAPEP